MNAIFHANRTGGFWRLLPIDFPLWMTVYSSLRERKQAGVYARFNGALSRACSSASQEERRTHRRHRRVAACQDLGKRWSRDTRAGRRLTGASAIWSSIPWTLGLLLKVKSSPADLSDQEGDQHLTELHEGQPTLKLRLYAEGDDQGPWEAWGKSTVDFTVEIVKRSDFDVRGYSLRGCWSPAGQKLTEEQIRTFRRRRRSFEVVKKCWTVERCCRLDDVPTTLKPGPSAAA